MRCHLCTDGLDHCHEVSIEHADGTTECGGDDGCDRHHLLHEWRITCAELDPPCRCSVAGRSEPSFPLAA